MKKFFMRMLCAFIPGKERRKRFRERFYPKKHVIIEDNGENTKIILPSAPPKGCVHIRVSGRNNVIEIADPLVSNGTSDISVCGNGNRVTIGRNVSVLRSLKIDLQGNENTAKIGEDTYFGDLLIRCGVDFRPVDGCRVVTGKACSFADTKIETYNFGTSVTIGNDCMFSHDVVLHHGDGHPVYDLESRKPINTVKELNIGDHCWIGMGALILKNVRLAHDTIVGAKSVVAKSFEEPNIAVAGNPAKKIKSGVTWTREDEAYTKNGF